MGFKVITYATHAQGMFDELKSSYPDLVVLGWGEKWTGFANRSKAIIKYIENMNDDDIVIVVDGFDTKIIKSPEVAVERFISSRSKLLFSKESAYKVSSIVYNICKGDSYLNAGLYMGYAKYVKVLLNEMVSNQKCKDDQVNFNKLCKKFDFIDVDTDYKIFFNVKAGYKYTNDKDVCFLGYPGQLTPYRVMRGIIEHSQFFLFYIVLILLLVTLKFPHMGTILTFLFFIWYIAFAEKSCIKTPRV
jgi:hypothetical protein